MPEGRLKKLLLRRHAGLVRSAHEDVKAPLGVIRFIINANKIRVSCAVGQRRRSGIAGMNQGGVGDVQVGVAGNPVEICRPDRSKLPEFAGEIFVRTLFPVSFSVQPKDMSEAVLPPLPYALDVVAGLPCSYKL